MKLSILCATLKCRRQVRRDLFNKIQKQIEGKPVEFLTQEDDGKLPTGTKRNKLLYRSSGEYVVFVDDDDDLHEHYVDYILREIETGADVIVFDTLYWSKDRAMPVYHSIEYKKNVNFDNYAQRLPNHLMPVKREHALKAKFPDTTLGEDYVYAERLKPHLKTQQKVSDYYMYIHYDK